MEAKVLEQVAKEVFGLLHGRIDTCEYAKENAEYILSEVANSVGVGGIAVDEFINIPGVRQTVVAGLMYHYILATMQLDGVSEVQVNEYRNNYHDKVEGLKEKFAEAECWCEEVCLCPECEDALTCSGCCDGDCDCGDFEDCDCVDCQLERDLAEEEQREEYVIQALGLIEAMKDERVFAKLREVVEFLSVADFV